MAHRIEAAAHPVADMIGDLLYEDARRWTCSFVKSARQKGEVDATWFKDRWDPSSGHYTQTGGRYLSFTFPSTTLMLTDFPLASLPDGTDDQALEDAEKVLDARFFEDLIGESDQIKKALDNEVEVDDGKISGIRWNVTDVAVTLEIQGRRVSVKVLAHLDADTSGAEAVPDEGRLASEDGLRVKVLRLAYLQPHLRGALLPFLKR